MDSQAYISELKQAIEDQTRKREQLIREHAQQHQTDNQVIQKLTTTIQELQEEIERLRSLL